MAEPAVEARLLQELRELGGDDDFFEELIKDFVVDAASLLDEMAATQRASALAEFKDHAHALRSSAANIGALRLHKMLLDLREIGKARLDSDGVSVIHALHDEFAQVREYFANDLGVKDFGVNTSSAIVLAPAAE